MSETNGFGPASAKSEFVCAGDDLKGILHMLTRQIADADHRNAAAMLDMQSRLEGLGREAEMAKGQISNHYLPTFERIKGGVAQLADRIANVGRERELEKSAAVATGAETIRTGQAAHVASTAAPAVQTIASPTVSAAMPSPSTVMADPANPWDRQAAEALIKLYDTGEAHVGQIEPATPITLAAAAPAAHAVNVPAAFAYADTIASAPVDRSDDRVWLEARFAAIAERVDQSLADIQLESSFVALDSRLDQLEQRFGRALEDVATRADVEGLRIVEAHINELAAQFEKTQTQIGRISVIEQQLGDVLTQVSDERFVELFSQMNPAPGPAATSEQDLVTIADVVSDRIAGQLSVLQQSFQPSVSGASAAGTDELRLLIENFVADQREGTDHTSSMLDTMQQAMIRLLDRMDAIENTGNIHLTGMHASVSHATPSRDAVHVAAGYQGYVEAPESFGSPESARQKVQMESAPTLRGERFAGPQMDGTLDQAAASTLHRASEATSGNAKQDFAAAARRAARAAASQKVDDELAVDSAQAKVSRQAALPKVGPAAAAPRSRVPLMVAGVALVAAVGILAASVGLNRGLPFKLNAKQVDVERQIGNAKATPLALEDESAGSIVERAPGTTLNGKMDAGPLSAPNSGAARQSGDRSGMARSAPGAAVNGMSDQLETEGPAPMLQQDAALPGQGTARVSLASSDGVSLGISVMQPEAQPTGQAIARAQQQRNMANLSSRLGAAQPVQGAVPAALMPDRGPVDAAGGVGGQGRTVNELPPVGVGPMSLRSAAANGDPSAEFEVAARFAEGRGITQDFKQAVVWYQRSAQRGFAPSQYRLGTLFERGIGTKADAARAKIWYGRAADQGNVKAMHNLAVLSAGRDQSTPDYETAVKWFTAAANLGLADSQFNLGVLHESGLGLPRDNKQAYHWLSLAARNGDKEAARRREAVRVKLDEAEVNQLDATVASWQAQPVQMMVNDARAAGDAWKRRQSVGQPG